MTSDGHDPATGLRRAALLVPRAWPSSRPSGSATRRSAPRTAATVFGWQLILPARERPRDAPRRGRCSPARSTPRSAAADTPIWLAVARRTLVHVPASRSPGCALGAVVGIGLGVLMARYQVVERGLLPYARPVADRAAHRARAARGRAGAASSRPSAVSGRGGCRSPCSARSSRSSRSRSATLRASVATARVARADGQLRRVVAADAVQAAVPGRRAVPRAGVQAGAPPPRWSAWSWPRSPPACAAASAG